jgi:hypothetical protein
MGEVFLDNENPDEWACEHVRIAKIWLSDSREGEIIPMTVKIGCYQHRFEGYLGNVGLQGYGIGLLRIINDHSIFGI